MYFNNKNREFQQSAILSQTGNMLAIFATFQKVREMYKLFYLFITFYALLNYYQVIAVSQLGEEVSGSINGKHAEFKQAGAVLLYNSTSGQAPIYPKREQVIEGDRPFERFGQKVKVTIALKQL